MLLETLALLELRELLNALVTAAVASAIFYGYIYPLYLHPLSKVPGPTICALTGAWILYKSWNEERNHYVDALHRQYGPIVRVGPNEVDISDADYLKDVYVHDFDKGRFYNQFVNYGSHCTFSTSDKKTHRESRKASAVFYSKSHVCSPEVQKNVTGVISQLLGVIDENQKTPVNVFILWSSMAMDAVNVFTFGKKYYEPILDDPFGRGRQIVNTFLVQSSSWFWTTQLPEVYDLVVKEPVNKATQVCCDYIERQFKNSLQSVGESESTLVNTLLGNSSQQSKLFDELRAKSECFDHVAAGHNTTATTLSYVYFELARHPEVQERLIDELKQFNGGKYLDSDDFTSQTYSEIEDLPFMNAVIDETMRVYAAIPGQEPRIVPPAGLQWRGSKETPPCMIPGGSVVTMQPWSLHRNISAFTDPNNWNPDRWMTADEDKLKVMRKNMIPFSAGARMCVGMNLAISEIKLNVSSIFSRYHVKLEEGFDYDGKSYLTDTYTSIPATGQMPIIFEAINPKKEVETSEKAAETVPAAAPVAPAEA